MRLLRFVAVACMVTVSVASLGCGETATPPAKKEADTSADTSSVTTPADTETAKTATTGTTPVSLAITGMA